jgi:hypothetical protein
VTKGEILTGSSQICRLCIRYESASNTAAVVAVVTGIVGFAIGLFQMSIVIIIVGLLAAIALFILIRNHMRERAQAEILGK